MMSFIYYKTLYYKFNLLIIIMLKKDHIFFDYNSTMPILPSVKQVMMQAINIIGNPSSVHCFGRDIRKKIELSRRMIAQQLKINRTDEIVFNSGATEGNNTIIKTFVHQNANIFISSIEHKCIMESAPNAIKIPVTQDGVIDLNQLQILLSKTPNTKPTLISVMLANNETGTIQPIKEIIKIAKQYNAFVHCDIAQALGKIEFDLQLYPVDYFTASSHKIGGPPGCGILYIKLHSPCYPLINGGGQEKNMRSGTLNTIGIIGFTEAIKCINVNQWQKCNSFISTIENEIMQFCSKANIWGKQTSRLPNTSSIHMPNVNNTTQLISFEIEGFAISAGSACASGTTSSSHVLTAMKIHDKSIQESIRVSISPMNTIQEVTMFIQAWKNVYKRAIQNKS